MNHILFVAIATLLLAASPFRAVAQPGNAANGERMYRACAPCHSLEPDRNMTGPSLAELWNRKSGGLPSFPRYSPALKSAGIIWNDDTLNEWIKDPQHFIPGNTMTFPGIKEPRQRADLLAYLKDANKPGHAPKAAQSGGQMGGMMMGGGQVPNLKALDPEDRVQSIDHCGDTYKVITADGKVHHTVVPGGDVQLTGDRSRLAGTGLVYCILDPQVSAIHRGPLTAMAPNGAHKP